MKVNKKVDKPYKTKKNSNLIATVMIAVVIIGLAVGIFLILQNALATEQYYALKQDVPAKTQVTSDMLEKIVTAKGTAPVNAITIGQVKQGTIYTKIPLKKGDILSVSNTGLSLDTSVGIPDDWSVTSFSLTADDSVGGNIAKGDYFDVIGINAEDGAKYLFFNVLALEVNYTTTQKQQGDNKAIIEEQIQYIVGMPSDSIPLLHHALAKFEKVKLALSPISLRYKDRNVMNLQDTFLQSMDLEPIDLYEGTDASFTPVLRDNKGLPVNENNCKAGIVEPASLCENLKDISQTETPKKIDTPSTTPTPSNVETNTDVTTPPQDDTVEVKSDSTNTSENEEISTKTDDNVETEEPTTEEETIVEEEPTTEISNEQP